MSVHDADPRHKSWREVAAGGLDSLCPEGVDYLTIRSVFGGRALADRPATTLRTTEASAMTAVTSEPTRRLGAPPDPAVLDPAERMSVEELRALQLERLQWTLRHAY